MDKRSVPVCRVKHDHQSIHLVLMSGADEEDEEFGWGEDDQDEDEDDGDRGKDRQNSDDAGVPDPATNTRAGGALGAMGVTEDTEVVGKGRSSEGGRLIVKDVLASQAGVADSNDMERLAEALRVSEAERASMVEALAGVEELTKERDAALAEVRLCTLPERG